MGTSKLEKGQAFNFDTEICVRCGVTRTQFQDTGEPPCTGRKADPVDEKRRTHHEIARDDE
jgi:hypothetical protein